MSVNDEKALSRSELVFAFALLLLGLLIRIIGAFHHFVDTDEPQHLHVVWGWLQGMLPYRDIFDNHTPLFHLLWTPMLRAVGETSAVIPLMRLTVLPVYILTLWAIFRLGQTLFSTRVGLWGAVLAGMFPAFFFCSLEFRPDGLWAALWFLALVVIAGGAMTRGRSFLAGLMLGMAMAVSMKTVLLLVALGIGAISAALFVYLKKDARGIQVRKLIWNSVMLLCGFAVVPSMILIFFARFGALDSLYYGTIQHNMLVATRKANRLGMHVLIFTAVCIGIAFIARRIARRSLVPELGFRRVLLFITTCIYIALLLCFWPLVERQHYLPFYPLLLLLVTAAVFEMQPRFARFKTIQWIVMGAAVLELALLCANKGVLRNQTLAQTQLLADVLQLTDTDDWVMDFKGETIFRRRPFYYGLEKITRQAIREGKIKDDIAERMISTGTCVAVDDQRKRFPTEAMNFLKENFVGIGTVRVAGMFLTPTNSQASIPFEIKIPARYTLLSGTQFAAGTLDGKPFQSSIILQAGHHDFLPSTNNGPFVLVWFQAFERGFLPKNYLPQ